LLGLLVGHLLGSGHDLLLDLLPQRGEELLRIQHLGALVRFQAQPRCLDSLPVLVHRYPPPRRRNRPRLPALCLTVARAIAGYSSSPSASHQPSWALPD